ncbi:hypothetical protein WN943_016224 [Citrus x changshan-huyou]
MVEDLLQHKTDEMEMDELGRKSFHVLYSRRFDGIKRFEGLHEVGHLRTFLALPLSTRKALYVTNIPCFSSHTRQLRAVSLCGYWIFQLPNNIGELKHLRALLSSREVVFGHREPCQLVASQKFSFKSIEEMPLRIGKLTSLRTLTKFAVGKSNCSGLSELRSSTLLHEKLTILGLENVNVAEDAKEVQLNGKEKLEALSLK